MSATCWTFRVGRAAASWTTVRALLAFVFGTSAATWTATASTITAVATTRRTVTGASAGALAWRSLWLCRSNISNRCGHFADNICHDCGVQVDLLKRNLQTSLAKQGGYVALLIRGANGDYGATGACTGGTARAVSVCLVFCRWINVYNKFHAVNVNAASSNVGGNKNLSLTRGEGS